MSTTTQSKKTDKKATLAPAVETEVVKQTNNSPDAIALDGDGLRIAPDISYDRWMKFGVSLAAMEKRTSFALGDWLNFGSGTFPKQYREAVLATGLTYGTLRNMASTAKRFPVGKRFPALSFEHHRLLAPLEDAKIEPIAQRVEAEKLSASAMKEILPEPEPKEKTPEQLKKEADKKDTALAAKITEISGEIQAVLQRPAKSFSDEARKAIHSALSSLFAELRDSKSKLDYLRPTKITNQL